MYVKCTWSENTSHLVENNRKYGNIYYGTNYTSIQTRYSDYIRLNQMFVSG